LLIDVTLKITPKMAADAQGNEKKALVGHLGTHFDIMDKEFPLEYTERKGIVFDVSEAAAQGREIDGIDLSLVEKDMFLAFYTGYIERVGYGNKEYFADHPQLSSALIETLIEKGVSIIGLDFAGVRRGKEHTPTDQHCAEHGVFIIENLCNLKTVLDHGGRFLAQTYPMNYEGVTGLPCRVIAKV